MFSLSAEACDPAANAVIVIPGMSHDGISALPLIGDLAGVNAPVTAIASAAIASTSQAFLAAQCGGLFGAYGTYVPKCVHQALCIFHIASLHSVHCTLWMQYTNVHFP